MDTEKMKIQDEQSVDWEEDTEIILDTSDDAGLIEGYEKVSFQDEQEIDWEDDKDINLDTPDDLLEGYEKVSLSAVGNGEEKKGFKEFGGSSVLDEEDIESMTDKERKKYLKEKKKRERKSESNAGAMKNVDKDGYSFEQKFDLVILMDANNGENLVKYFKKSGVNVTRIYYEAAEAKEDLMESYDNTRMVIIESGRGRYNNTIRRGQLMELLSLADSYSKITLYYTDDYLVNNIKKSGIGKNKFLRAVPYVGTSEILADIASEGITFTEGNHETESSEGILQFKGERVELNKGRSSKKITIEEAERKKELTIHTMDRTDDEKYDELVAYKQKI